MIGGSKVAVVGVVFARAGSKGLPGKNLLPLGGIPLVGLAVRTGLAVPEVSTVYCSSDSEEILRVARDFGASTPFIRPKELSSDSSPELLSWKHLAQHLIASGADPQDIILSLPPTAPLRAVIDVERVIAKLRSGSGDIVITYSEAAQNPWFTMITVDKAGSVNSLHPPGEKTITRRQDAPKVFTIVPVAYATTIRYVLETESLFSGNVLGVEVPRERAVDIDTEFDFRVAEAIFERPFASTSENNAPV